MSLGQSPPHRRSALSSDQAVEWFILFNLENLKSQRLQCLSVLWPAVLMDKGCLLMPRLKLLHVNFCASCVFLPAHSHFEGILKVTFLQALWAAAGPPKAIFAPVKQVHFPCGSSPTSPHRTHAPAPASTLSSLQFISVLFLVGGARTAMSRCCVMSAKQGTENSSWSLSLFLFIQPWAIIAVRLTAGPCSVCCPPKPSILLLRFPPLQI